MNRKIQREKTLFQMLFVMLMDVLIMIASDGFALIVRYDLSFEAIPEQYVAMMYRYLPLQIAVTVVVFLVLRMYSFLWRSVSSRDAVKMLASSIIAYASAVVVCSMFGLRMSFSVLFMGLMVQVALFTGIRCSLRLIHVAAVLVRARLIEPGERIMLIGGGAAGRMLAREIVETKKLSGKIYCVIDDNPALWGKFMEGIPVVGGREKIPQEAKKRHITQIIFAIPTASPQSKREILEICQQTGCKVRSLPGIYQMVNGEASLSSVQDVKLEDLLGREPVALDQTRMEGFLRNQSVLVTGGGGSIGSELCRQIARFRPRHLIIVDIYENNAYTIQQELRRRYGDALNLTVEIASVRDRERIFSLFDVYRPELVFHAAAHKHVPLMEGCPAEAVKNNIFGTYHVVRAAEKVGVKKFVMISTDKAVNPTSFMGATKRFCEMILQSRMRADTIFCAVRFGNVLGSNGSVIPLFRQQIQDGGPVTITDKRIIRYFMTIPEAAQLVLEAGAVAQRGQIFVLDMGEPVKILALAENLIRLSGLRPYEDIAIQEIGLRPGEKLYEELLMDNSNLDKTHNRKIFVEQQKELNREEIRMYLMRLNQAVLENEPPEQLLSLLKEIVPTYRSPEEVNREKTEERENSPVSA